MFCKSNKKQGSQKNAQSVHIHTLEHQIHPSDFYSVHENYALKSTAGSKNTLFPPLATKSKTNEPT